MSQKSLALAVREKKGERVKVKVKETGESITYIYQFDSFAPAIGTSYERRARQYRIINDIWLPEALVPKSDELKLRMIRNV